MCFTEDEQHLQWSVEDSVMHATMMNDLRNVLGSVLLKLSQANAERQISLVQMGVLETCASYLLDPDITQHPATRFSHLATCAAMASNLLVRVRANRVRAYLAFPDPSLLITRWLRISALAPSIDMQYMFFHFFGAMRGANWLLPDQGTLSNGEGEQGGSSDEAIMRQGDQLLRAFASSSEAITLLCEYLSCDISSTRWPLRPDFCLRGRQPHTHTPCPRSHTLVHKHTHTHTHARTHTHTHLNTNTQAL
jgi:hypothetical protein